MASSLLDTIFGTIKTVTNDFDDKKIEEYTGQKVDSVDQFMARTSKFGTKDYAKGFLAGVIGGLVGVAIKMLVDGEVAPDTVHSEDDISAAAVEGIENVAGDIFTDDQEEVVATIIEFGMGALIGGAYGLLIEAIPDAQKISSDQLMTTTKQLALPMLGLVPAIGSDVANDKAQNLAGHAAFVGTVEVVRRAVRLGLDEG
ncbi:DUF1440 domain-containing protein [Neolewinella antarctica]|uniref:Membrane protein YagU involved in acid resistance n=1 Tax=Neolewinella antarctica TaxID=442734 RepID=A0ABX0XFS2_9BACT|nr:DUF1440 domain-containing protein [Neolewinella antarctica]NJC27980.1 putative membrane protein YagU involved in acid resistance [Neolewinella antarctica]